MRTTALDISEKIAKGRLAAYFAEKTPTPPPKEECPLRGTPVKCINCSGDHLATSHECPVICKHKMILSLAAQENTYRWLMLEII